VRATNMMTGETTVLPGNETLMLDPVSGIDLVNAKDNGIRLFPNPVENKSNLLLSKAESGDIRIEIKTITGQEIMSRDITLEAGTHIFSLSFDRPGIYLINCRSKDYCSSVCAVCTRTSSGATDIIHNGFDQSGLVFSPASPKTMNIVSKLSYTPGDVIHFKCFSIGLTTIFTDIPESSKTYTVNFYECQDESGTGYEIVKIGNQFWMAENLAYLPSVNNQYEESFTEPRYYVYGYEGNLVSEAMELNNYLDYGVLYNWEAAMESCPDGWRLPTEDEWNILVDYLGGSAGMMMKSTSGWEEDANGNNHSGLNALPAGRRSADVFKDLGKSASFWSSTEDGVYNARGKSLSYLFDGVANLFSGRHVGNAVRCIKD